MAFQSFLGLVKELERGFPQQRVVTSEQALGFQPLVRETLSSPEFIRSHALKKSAEF